MNPQVDYFREQATEGISEGRESFARTDAIQRLFRPQDTSIYGGNQARAIAGQQQRNQQAQTALSQFESNLQQADIQAQQQGQRGFAKAQTQQNRIQSRQEAAIREAELKYETELQRRRQQVGSTIAGIAGSLLTTPFGGGGSLVSRGLSALVGGGAQAAGQAAVDAMSDTARSTVDTGQGAQSLDMNLPSEQDVAMNFDEGEPLDMPQQQGGTVTPQQALEQDRETAPIDQAFVGTDQYDLRQQKRTDEFLEEMNFGDNEPITPREDKLLGEQLYDPASDFVGKYFGDVGRFGLSVGTSIPRGLLNLGDMLGREYGTALEQFQGEQGVNY